MKKKYVVIIGASLIVLFFIIVQGFKNPINNNNDNDINKSTVINKSDSNKKVIDDDKKKDNKTNNDAQKVAESFIKAITIYDFNNPNLMAKNAVKYVCDDKKKEVESLYIHLGKGEDIKKTVLESIDSESEENEEQNDYIYYRVNVKWSSIDKNNQKISGGDESYMTKLLKVDGEYKIIEYWVD